MAHRRPARGDAARDVADAGEAHDAVPRPSTRATAAAAPRVRAAPRAWPRSELGRAEGGHGSSERPGSPSAAASAACGPWPRPSATRSRCSRPTGVADPGVAAHALRRASAPNTPPSGTSRSDAGVAGACQTCASEAPCPPAAASRCRIRRRGGGSRPGQSPGCPPWNSRRACSARRSRMPGPLSKARISTPPHRRRLQSARGGSRRRRACLTRFVAASRDDRKACRRSAASESDADAARERDGFAPRLRQPGCASSTGDLAVHLPSRDRDTRALARRRTRSRIRSTSRRAPPRPRPSPLPVVKPSLIACATSAMPGP